MQISGVCADLVVLARNLQIKAIRIQQEIHDAHNNYSLFIAPQLDSVLHYNDFLERIVNANQRILLLFHFILARNSKCRLNIVSAAAKIATTLTSPIRDNKQALRLLHRQGLDLLIVFVRLVRPTSPLTSLPLQPLQP